MSSLKKQSGISFLVGFIFALGLGISGMTQPQKVIGFLNILGGAWDPSLIFVMIGSILVHAASYVFIKNRHSPLFDTKWHVPNRRDITPGLLIGSVLFGMGWGLGGFCPGPGLTSLASGQNSAFLFVVTMIAGMYLYRLFDGVVKIRK